MTTGAGLIDLTAVPDVYADGFGRVEVLPSGMLRMTLYATHNDGDGPPMRVIVARIVLPPGAIPGGIARVRDAFGHVLIEEDGRITAQSH